MRTQRIEEIELTYTELDFDPLLGLQTAVTGPDGLETSFQYDATPCSRPGAYGLVEKRGYDAAMGRLASIRTGPGQTSMLQDLSFEWDLAGNLSQREARNESGVLLYTEAFANDALDRLTTVTRDQSAVMDLTCQGIVRELEHVGGVHHQYVRMAA